MKQSKQGITPNFVFDWKGVLIIVLSMIGVNILLMFFAALCKSLGFGDIFYNDWFLIIGNLLTFLSIIIGFDFLVCRPTTGRKLNFRMTTSPFATYLLVFPMMIGGMLIVDVVSTFLPTEGKLWGKLYEYFQRLMQLIGSDIAFMLLVSVLMAPLFEEIVFRGILQRGLINGGMAPKYAIIIASVVFGLVHGNPWQFLGGVILGSIMGLVYYRTKTLLLPILLHAFNNLVSTLLFFYVGEDATFVELLGISKWLVLAIGFIIFVIFYILFTRHYRIHYSE